MTYQQFVINAEKDAPEAEYMSHDGTVRINCGEIWDTIKDDYYCRTEDAVITKIVDVMIHEDDHKAFAEAMLESETFNEQDERVMMCVRDWVERDIKRSFVEYDWK